MTATPNAQLFIGLISGTSMDGIDAALVRFGSHQCEAICTHSHPYPAPLRDELLEASRNPRSCTVDDVGRLDRQVGECFRDAAQNLLDGTNTAPADVRAIGSHGQTLRHLPDADTPFTLQIGDPNVIAAGTRITTVADFRRRDLAAGGEAAPLTPLFHRWLFADDAEDRVVLNVGGIANVTLLPASGNDVTGFDTGPGNTLLDAWIRREQGREYDVDGAWASSAAPSAALLERLLSDAYFRRPPPKSTGFEYFNLSWLAGFLDESPSPAATVQATLLALTVQSIADAVERHAPSAARIIVCGGGSHNRALMQGLSTAIAVPVVTTEDFGLDADWVEAAAFAWLARETLEGRAGNVPSVTGADRAEVLGGIYLCAS